jgi:hypothetical protein
LKFYADVHRTKKNSERFRITYTVDGTTFKTGYSWIQYHPSILTVL